MDYPVWGITLGGPMLMAIVAVAHVIVSHFAVGGGLVLAVTETMAVRRSDEDLRQLAKRGSLVLILVSTVFGAISGVGIWVVAGLISPAAISALIHNYVWGWAMEWVFFIVEIVAALVYYTTWDRISKGAHLLVIWIYAFAAYMSLIIINGIITFQLTPGRWLATRSFWDGFFNPTYFPATLLRTGICLMMATAFLVFPALKTTPDSRSRVLRFLGFWMVGGVLMSYGGYRWWEAVLPDQVRAIFLGSQPLLPALAMTRHVTLWAMAATLVLAVILLLAAPKAMRAATALVLALAAFVSLGGYERLREGARKPFLIHDFMFSNGLRIDQIEAYNRDGVAAHSGWVAAAGEDPHALGEALFRAQCSSCHTLDGYQAIREALPTFSEMVAVVADDPPGTSGRVFSEQCASCHADSSAEEMKESLPSAEEMRSDPASMQDLIGGMISASLYQLKEMGDVYTASPPDQPIDLSSLSKPYMPPFVGSDDELDALATYLKSLATGEDQPTEGGV